MTRMEVPIEQLLDWLEPPVTTIIADTELSLAVPIGKRRNISVASLWTSSASVYSMFHHFDLLVQHNHFPIDFLGHGDECVDYIPGIPSMHIADLPTIFYKNHGQVLQCALECISWVPKAQYLLFTSVYELEAEFIDTFSAKFPFPVYTIGPAIPYLELHNTSSLSTTPKGPKYLQWLDSQPKGSVLYVSLGSFLSVSSAQMDEIVAGVQSCGVRYFWVARGETYRFKEGCDDMGVVVRWCDQLKVLCHSSIGGFWSHCGWNSTLEAVFAGVPMLTFPIFWDQVPNSKQVVDDWKIGWRVKKEVTSETLVTRGEIAELVQRFMDPENNKGKEIGRRAKELGAICQGAIANCGSSETNLDAFIRDISQGRAL